MCGAGPCSQLPRDDGKKPRLNHEPAARCDRAAKRPDVMADGIYSQHGLPFDALGDVAQNDGAAGHQTRHKEVLLDLVELLRGKLGRGAVEHEFHCEHSTTRTVGGR